MLFSPAPIRIARSPGGWTLIEILVVVGIIAVLIGILIPALSRGRQSAEIGATKQLMAGLGTALNLYRNDSALGNAFPPSASSKMSGTMFGKASTSYSSWNGGEILAQALLGYLADDGKTGLGFTRSGAASGTAYGPYMSPDTYEVGAGPNGKVFRDQWDGAISYYRASPQPADTSKTYSLWGTGGTSSVVRFNKDDNEDIASDPLMDQQLSVDQPSLLAAPFLLYSKGPDGLNSDTEERKDDIVILGQ